MVTVLSSVRLSSGSNQLECAFRFALLRRFSRRDCRFRELFMESSVGELVRPESAKYPAGERHDFLFPVGAVPRIAIDSRLTIPCRRSMLLSRTSGLADD